MNNNSTFRHSDCRKPSQLLQNFDTITAGIDKLNITTRGYIVPDAGRLNIDYYGRKAGNDAPIQQQLFISEGGELIEGRRAYFNGEGYGLNISSYGLNVVMSPAKVLHPSQPFVLPSTPDEVAAAADIVTKRIKHDTGVLFDYAEAIVCRMDIARQKALNRPISDYAEAFSTLRLKGSRQHRRTYGLQTFQFNDSGSSHQLVFYDKIAEYLSGLTPSQVSDAMRPLMQGSNHLRAELRLLKTDYIKKATATDANFISILNGGGDGWQRVYLHYLNSKLFTGTYEQRLHFDNDRLRALFAALQQQGNGSGRYIVRQAAAAIGIRVIVDEVGIDEFLKVAADYIKERQLRNVRNYIKEAAAISNGIFQPIDTLTLINDLRQAFAA